MKSKPVVMDHFSTVHTSFVIDFTFDSNITLLMGDSGTGKSASYSYIKECMSMNPDILCINYLEYQKDIGEMIRAATGKLIVIDNADVLLDDGIRKFIALDDKNQYLIIGRNPKNLFATKDNLYELVSEKKNDQTVLKLKNYL